MLRTINIIQLLDSNYTHPDGGEDLVGLDVLETVLLLALVHQLQMRLKVCRTKGAERQRGRPWW